MSVEATLAERGSRYGDFSDHALVAQELQNVMRTPFNDDSRGWPALSAVQKQALTVIADKIARILSGDPNYADNWHDIQGYAKLVEDRLPGAAKPEVTIWDDWDGKAEGAEYGPKDAGKVIEVMLRDGTRGTPNNVWRWYFDPAAGDQSDDVVAICRKL